MDKVWDEFKNALELAGFDEVKFYKNAGSLDEVDGGEISSPVKALESSFIYCSIDFEKALIESGVMKDFNLSHKQIKMLAKNMAMESEWNSTFIVVSLGVLFTGADLGWKPEIDDLRLFSLCQKVEDHLNYQLEMLKTEYAPKIFSNKTLVKETTENKGRGK